jgi:hypothetical protein
VPAPHFLPLHVEEPPLEALDEELTLADVDDLPPPERSTPLEPLPLEPAPVQSLVQLAPLPPVAPRPRPARPRRQRSEPAQRPTARSKVRLEQWVDSVPWSAEEFDGELADRVRRSEPIVEYVEGPLRSAAQSIDDEPLEVQFDDEAHQARRNGRQSR